MAIRRSQGCVNEETADASAQGSQPANVEGAGRFRVGRSANCRRRSRRCTGRSPMPEWYQPTPAEFWSRPRGRLDRLMHPPALSDRTRAWASSFPLLPPAGFSIKSGHDLRDQGSSIYHYSSLAASGRLLRSPRGVSPPRRRDGNSTRSCIARRLDWPSGQRSRAPR